MNFISMNQTIYSYTVLFAVKEEPYYYAYIQGDSFGTRPKKMRISQRLFIRY